MQFRDAEDPDDDNNGILDVDQELLSQIVSMERNNHRLTTITMELSIGQTMTGMAMV